MNACVHVFPERHENTIHTVVATVIVLKIIVELGQTFNVERVLLNVIAVIMKLYISI